MCRNGYKHSKSQEYPSYRRYSSHGDTARLFKKDGDLNVVCAAYAYGFGEPGVNIMKKETVDALEKEGIRTLFTTRVLSGADTAVILRPAHANHVPDTKIKEILCKLREF